MGSVFEVRLPGDPRRLAAKVLAERTAVARERFRREGELMGRLRHPGIVSLHDAGASSDGWPYLLFDLVEGRSLEENLRAEASLPVERAVAWGIELAEALGHAHGQGIVHRDVKPANVLVDASGRTRLTDFGIALAADQQRLTRQGNWTGTLLYMAPEQLSGERSIGPATDVYALGAVLFEMLAGRKPFEADSTEGLVHRVLGEHPADLRRLRGGLPVDLVDVVERTRPWPGAGSATSRARPPSWRRRGPEASTGRGGSGLRRPSSSTATSRPASTRRSPPWPTPSTRRRGAEGRRSPTDPATPRGRGSAGSVRLTPTRGELRTG